jgi:uncharacterized protein (DUF1800 family)
MGTSRALVTHLYRRAAFGASSATITRQSKRSWDSIVDDLMAGLHEKDTAGDKVKLPHLTTIPQSNVPGYTWNSWEEFTNLITWWIERMVVSDTPLREKMVLLLHNQFPTSWDKVQYAYLMYVQNQIFRTKGAGNFEKLTQAIAVDPSMLIWLDAATSHKDDPNQNFARELMERFTMGAGNYTETDVIQAARCFTGWELDMQRGNFYQNSYDHDNGVKTVLGHRGRFTGQEIVSLVTNTRASHHWVPARMWSFLAYPTTPKSRVVADLAGVYAKNLSMADLLEAILRHPDFRSAQAVHGLVKQPIEYVVGVMRTLGLRTSALGQGSLEWLLGNLGQTPFAPPSVGGWGQNEYWLTTTASNSYLGLASTLAGLADLTNIENHNGSPSAQVSAVKELLDLPDWSRNTTDALFYLAREMKTWTGSSPAQQLVTLALVSPEYLMN